MSMLLVGCMIANGLAGAQGLNAGSRWQLPLSHRSTVSSLSAERYVALGDSVSYGHGLANPYTRVQIGTGTSVSEGPSPRAWPSLVAEGLGLKMVRRSSNCAKGESLLPGDQLSVSGAQASATLAAEAAPTPTNAPNYQCPGRNRSVQGTELPAANLAAHPARLVTIQAGADDIDFSGCLEYLVLHNHLGRDCANNGQVTSYVGDRLPYVKAALASIIESVSPYAHEVVVVDYYDPIPAPNDFDESSTSIGTSINSICQGLQLNKREAYNDSVTITTSLDNTIIEAVDEAKSHGYSNVLLVNISSLLAHHEMCTKDPAVFSGEAIGEDALRTDLAAIASCKAAGFLCSAATSAQEDIEQHTWRAAHPNVLGQRDIARAVLAALGRATPSTSSSTWTATEVPVPAGSSGINEGFGPVSCGTGTCAALGDDSGETWRDFIDTLTNGSWSAIQAPLPMGYASEGPADLFSVACGGTGSCAAVGSFEAGSGTDRDPGQRYLERYPASASGQWN